MTLSECSRRASWLAILSDPESRLRSRWPSLSLSRFSAFFLFFFLYYTLYENLSALRRWIPAGVLPAAACFFTHLAAYGDIRPMGQRGLRKPNSLSATSASWFDKSRQSGRRRSTRRVGSSPSSQRVAGRAGGRADVCMDQFARQSAAILDGNPLVRVTIAFWGPHINHQLAGDQLLDRVA